MAIRDKVLHYRGTLSKLPTLDIGRIGMILDAGTERLVFGTPQGNINVPNQSELTDVQNISNKAIDTANTAINTANNAYATANNAILATEATQNQVANIITSNGDGTKDTELVDARTDNNGIVYTSTGNHIRALDIDYSILKGIQTYTAISDNTTTITIPNIVGLDLTQCNIDVFYEGIKLKLTTEYTIDTTNRTINLVDWNIDNGDVIEYRIYR